MNETNIAKPTEQDIVTRIVNAIELDVSFLFSSFNSQSKVFRAILSPNPNSNINISSLQTTLLKILEETTNTKWGPYTSNRDANPRHGKSTFPKHNIISSSKSYEYQVQGSKSLIRNTDKKQRGWVAKAVYGLIPDARKQDEKQYKQSTDWRRQADNIYTDLEEVEYKNRPKQAISQLRKNKLHSNAIKQDQIQIMDEKGLVFTVTRKVRDEERTYTVNILDGFCSCYSFVQNKVPCVDMYAVFRYYAQNKMGCDMPFSLLPSSVLDSTVMRIQSTIDLPPAIDNTSSFDLPPAIDHPSIPMLPLVDPPIPESRQKRARKYKQTLIDAVKHALDLAHSLDFDELEAILDDSVDPLKLVQTAQAAMLKHKPSAKRRRVSLPTKSTIPNKIRSKPQQRLYEKRRDKRERHKLRKPIAPNVPYDVFIANEQQQRDALQQRTQSVIARKEEQMRKIPEHMKFDSADDIDMNDTISYNYQNTRTSSRAIRPSSAMLESMKYQKRMNGQPQ
eukprot:1162611_1